MSVYVVVTEGKTLSCWHTHTHTHTHTDYTELPLSRNAVLESIQGFQGQHDLHRPLLCEGGLICKGETTQLLFMLITGGWIWQLDKTHTHTHTHTQWGASSTVFQGCSCKESPSASHWYGDTASYMQTSNIHMQLCSLTTRCCCCCCRSCCDLCSVISKSPSQLHWQWCNVTK